MLAFVTLAVAALPFASAFLTAGQSPVTSLLKRQSLPAIPSQCASQCGNIASLCPTADTQALLTCACGSTFQGLLATCLPCIYELAPSVFNGQNPTQIISALQGQCAQLAALTTTAAGTPAAPGTTTSAVAPVVTSPAAPATTTSAAAATTSAVVGSASSVRASGTAPTTLSVLASASRAASSIIGSASSVRVSASAAAAASSTRASSGEKVHVAHGAALVGAFAAGAFALLA